jgi:hypothetical protein
MREAKLQGTSWSPTIAPARASGFLRIARAGAAGPVTVTF